MVKIGEYQQKNTQANPICINMLFERISILVLIILLSTKRQNFPKQINFKDIDPPNLLLYLDNKQLVVIFNGLFVCSRHD